MTQDERSAAYEARLIGDPDSIAREIEVLIPSVAANLRHYAKLKEAVWLFGAKVEHMRSIPLDLWQAWEQIKDVLKEIRE